MWNRRKEEPTPSPTATPSYGEGLPINAMSSRMDQHDAPLPSRTATVGKGVSIVGQISSREDLIIDGEVDGTIEAVEHKVTIGPNGKVKAGIKAKDIVVIGAVQGNVEASDKMEIKKDARLVGDIRTARISIEDGAIFKGSIDIVRTEVPKAAPKPQVAPAVAPATKQSLAASAGGETKR
jgi:cytoskeletal protein CcmA (bactofilin family)